MYTGLDRNAFDILPKFLEPVVPSYGNNLEEIHAMRQGVHTHLTTEVTYDSNVDTKKSFAGGSSSVFRH